MCSTCAAAEVRRGAAAVLALAGGLAFSEKTLLAVPLVVALTYAYAAGGAPWPRLRELWREHRRVWGAYLLLCVPYTIYYVLAVPSPGRSGAKGGQLVSLGTTAVRDGIFLGLLGGPWTWHPIGFAGALAAPGTIATFVSAVVVVAVIIATVAWNRGAAPAWTIAAGFRGRGRGAARRHAGRALRTHPGLGVPLLHRLRVGRHPGHRPEHDPDRGNVRSR